MVLPFVDESRIENSDQEARVVSMLRTVLPYAEKASVEVHLETSLEPKRFAQFLAKLPHPMLRVNYDSGNSASLGYDVRLELSAYGSRIGSVHIKDRERDGSTVPLGAGRADFTTLFSGLSALSYPGDYVLQVARGLSGEEIAWARQNRAFVRQHVEESTRIACGAPR
jgi:hexulose-6-phosphate isomerase